MTALKIAAAALLAVVTLQAAPAVGYGYRGETYTCVFPKAGKVILDTREPGAFIIYRKKRHPATSGSYFYQSESTKISMAFNPPMTKWTLTLWDQPEPQPEKARRCTKVKNRR